MRPLLRRDSTHPSPPPKKPEPDNPNHAVNSSPRPPCKYFLLCRLKCLCPHLSLFEAHHRALPSAGALQPNPYPFGFLPRPAPSQHKPSCETPTNSPAMSPAILQQSRTESAISSEEMYHNGNTQKRTAHDGPSEVVLPHDARQVVCQKQDAF